MKNGFTLLELSIVLVIIGLIIGGITVGASLIKSAELQSVTKEYNQYKVAFYTFKMKYNGWPGDLNNATSYWPTNSRYTGFVTGNGDGDGLIEGYTESFYAWEHISAAEMIAGQFNGLSNAGGDGVVNPDVDAPASALGDNEWVPMHFSYSSHGMAALGTAAMNNFYLGGNIVSGGYDYTIDCEDSYNIDQKYDDGKPYKGQITSPRPFCKDSSVLIDADWVPSDTTAKAILRFKVE